MNDPSDSSNIGVACGPNTDEQIERQIVDPADGRAALRVEYRLYTLQRGEVRRSTASARTAVYHSGKQPDN